MSWRLYSITNRLAPTRTVTVKSHKLLQASAVWAAPTGRVLHTGCVLLSCVTSTWRAGYSFGTFAFIFCFDIKGALCSFGAEIKYHIVLPFTMVIRS